ncbi:hypothetical protein BDY19DRAFT_724040 [Irpex rosettiformis]|uniref:Uncharacterized protein n=1 Tax=Irpex rosettiformis TaxID=378272 RepID=A0ACB8U8S0_9APHY|nr:hypothetical protein BDY19DRAFT_724040 [Irpex rosettiformis]
MSHPGDLPNKAAMGASTPESLNLLSQISSKPFFRCPSHSTTNLLPTQHLDFCFLFMLRVLIDLRHRGPVIDCMGRYNRCDCLCRTLAPDILRFMRARGNGGHETSRLGCLYRIDIDKNSCSLSRKIHCMRHMVPSIFGAYSSSHFQPQRR